MLTLQEQTLYRLKQCKASNKIKQLAFGGEPYNDRVSALHIFREFSLCWIEVE